MAFDQVSPNPRNSQQGASLGLISLLRPPVPEISQELRPRIFPRSQKNSIRVLGSFLWQRGNVQASKSDKGALLPIVIGDLVRPARRGDIDLDDDQVWFVLEIEGFDVFVGKRDFVVWIEVSRQSRQPERRKERVFDGPKERALGFCQRWQNQFHFHSQA